MGCLDEVVEHSITMTEGAKFVAEDGSVIAPQPMAETNDSDDDVEIPRGSQKTDWEVELGVVIGRPGRHISSAQEYPSVRPQELGRRCQTEGEHSTAAQT